MPSLSISLLLEIGGDGVLQLLGLVVHLVPLQPEDLRQHALDQVMAIQKTIGDVAALGGQRDLAFLAHLDQRIAPQSLDRHGDRRRGYAEASGPASPP